MSSFHARLAEICKLKSIQLYYLFDYKSNDSLITYQILSCGITPAKFLTSEYSPTLHITLYKNNARPFEKNSEGTPKNTFSK